ncbi:MAG: hypothetical protein EZS28_017067 [Streblomastix strix]|uniref:Uncharacterized protein n=1 Tax=Streblomastix strix TaxID=222440 RepID=A0A5J4VXW2_9EUKA|nr:MAG: hypothetical protein EZS28_017067 [Streblomastix strix]
MSLSSIATSLYYEMVKLRCFSRNFPRAKTRHNLSKNFNSIDVVCQKENVIDPRIPISRKIELNERLIRRLSAGYSSDCQKRFAKCQGTIPQCQYRRLSQALAILTQDNVFARFLHQHNSFNASSGKIIIQVQLMF